jgi:hypothetical protein
MGIVFDTHILLLTVGYWRFIGGDREFREFRELREFGEILIFVKQELHQHPPPKNKF